MAYIVENRRHLHISDAELESRPKRVQEQGDTSALTVWDAEGQRHGVWQMTPGILPGVKGPETVVIIEGEVTVHIEPEGQDYELRAGDVFIIDAGDTATWHVHKTVRKFFVVNSQMNAAAGQ